MRVKKQPACGKRTAFSKGFASREASGIGKAVRLVPTGPESRRRGGCVHPFRSLSISVCRSACSMPPVCWSITCPSALMMTVSGI